MLAFDHVRSYLPAHAECACQVDIGDLGPEFVGVIGGVSSTADSRRVDEDVDRGFILNFGDSSGDHLRIRHVEYECSVITSGAVGGRLQTEFVAISENHRGLGSR